MADNHPHRNPKTLLGHPLGLYTLFFTEMWERFSFYGMKALLLLYMVEYLVWDQQEASEVFKWYTSLVYFTPVFGGLIADYFLGARRSVVIGCVLITIGHLCLAFEPLPYFYAGLGFLILGVGFLKANISTQVGAMYHPGDPRRDAGFTIFYMICATGLASRSASWTATGRSPTAVPSTASAPASPFTPTTT